MTIFLTAEEVLRIQDKIAPTAALVDRGAIEAAVMRPQTTVGGEDAYPTIHDKAAAFWISLDHAQAFQDGSKRTAYHCTNMFYALNAYVLTLTDDELYEVAMRVARHEVDVTELAEFLNSVAQPVPPLRELADGIAGSEIISLPTEPRRTPAGEQ